MILSACFYSSQCFLLPIFLIFNLFIYLFFRSFGPINRIVHHGKDYTDKNKTRVGSHNTLYVHKTNLPSD
jgi:hypothetical protein